MRKFLSLRAILVLLGILGIVVYALVPNRERFENLVPAPVGAAEFYVYDDSADGGGSRAYLATSDTLILFDFALGNQQKPSPYCGFGWDFATKGRRNWSFMDSVVLEVRATGMDQVILKVLTYDPDHSEEGKNNTLRPLIKEVPVGPGWQRVAIPVEDLYVPDYWYQDNNISTRYDTKHLESVVRVEFAPGWEAPRGKPLGLQVRQMQVRGSSNLYFGILVAWVLVLIIAAMGVRTPSSEERK